MPYVLYLCLYLSHGSVLVAGVDDGVLLDVLGFDGLVGEIHAVILCLLLLNLEGPPHRPHHLVIVVIRVIELR